MIARRGQLRRGRLLGCAPGMRKVVVAVLLVAAPAQAQRWDDATTVTIGTTSEWTNKVEVADVDGDGWVDILFANGGNYFDAGTPQPQRVFRNLGNWDANAAQFEEVTATMFGAVGARLSRVIKVRDVDGDGDQDVLVGGAHATASGLFVQGPAGIYTDASGQLPAGNVTLGDAEFGDVDMDGDLDLVLADWGGNPEDVAGGQTKLWLNDGDGTFADATATRMPQELVGMSWDLEVIDVDDDADLDVLVSCKLCDGGRLYLNDGAGMFTDAPGQLPQAGNNYEYEPMDVDGDGDLDLVTINDGPQLRETLLINDGDGTFVDDTAVRLTGAGNPANADDNVEAFLDVDDDGDADFLVGCLGSAGADDRLLINDGAGRFTLEAGAITLATPGTLGLALADLNHDDRLEIVQGQGEVANPDKVLLANPGVAADTHGPALRILRRAYTDDRLLVVRLHDRKSPSLPHDWGEVIVEPTAPGTTDDLVMTWRGEYLWAAVLDGDEFSSYRICATDAAGNQTCSPQLEIIDEPLVDAGAGPDADPGADGGGGGCCRTSRGSESGTTLVLLALAALASRRRRISSRA